MNKLFLTLPLLSLSLSSYASAKDEPSTTHDENRRDVDLTAKIRRSVDEDQSLSRTARHVKVSAHEGVVTLRGPVETNIERLVVSEKAKDIAGEQNVKNELRVTH